MNSGNLINHWSLNRSQFKHPVSHMCLAGAVVASWSLTHELAGLNEPFCCNDIFLSQNSLNSVKTFREQECIPVGCVPPASVADTQVDTLWAATPPADTNPPLPPADTYAQLHAGIHTPLPLYITFPQLLSLAVKTQRYPNNRVWWMKRVASISNSDTLD